MWGQNKTKWKNGISGLGKYGVNSNNEIIPNLQFQRKNFKGGIAKRFGEYNTVILEEEEEELQIRDRVGKGYLYIHGNNSPYYAGTIIYNRETELFSAIFEQNEYPVFSDCVIFKRMSYAKDKVGLVYGSTGKDRVRDYSPASIANGDVYTKRFEYQSITKSSLDQETAFRRDKNYYSKVFEELYEKGRPNEFETKLCCYQCGKYYYTGNLMPAENSKCVAINEEGANAAGIFYTIDGNKDKQVSNPQHKQYVAAEVWDNLKDCEIIRFNELDITKYKWDYRIIYYPEWYFGAAYINYYQGSMKGIQCNARYGLTKNGEPININQYTKENDFWYISYANFMYYVCSYNANWAEKPSPMVEITTQINQSITHAEDYRWEAVSWHSSKGVNYMTGNNWAPMEYQTGGVKSRPMAGAFYYDSGSDEYVRSCNFAKGRVSNRGGALHNAPGGFEVTTTRTCGHLIKGFTDVSLEISEYFLNLYDTTYRPAGEFLSDPANSESLTDDELAENGITPKNETTSVEEITKEQYYQGRIDPFEITMVSNFSTSNVNLQLYSPHVFFNRQKYNRIKETEEKLSDSSTENNLNYITIKLLQKNSDGSANSSGSGYVQVNDEDYINNYENGYYLKQKTRTERVSFYNKNTEQFEEYDAQFADGSEKVYFRDEDTDRPANNMFKKNELPSSMKHDSKGRTAEEGFEFRDINQRLCAALGKYSFLAIGYNTGWAGSVFNKYIFLNLLPDKEKIYEDSEDSDGSDMDTLDHNELGKINILNNPPKLLRILTSEELDAREEAYKKRMSGFNKKIRMTGSRYNLLQCESYWWWKWYKRDVGGCQYEGGGTFKISDRKVDVEYPWILLETTKTKSGVVYHTYGIDTRAGSSNLSYNYDDLKDLDGNSNTTFNDDFGSGNTSDINNGLNKYRYTEEVSPVWKNVNIPGAYLTYYSNLNRIGSSYAEYRLYFTRTKGKLLYAYNANYSIQRPWAGNIVTAAGCCPIRSKNKYFIFDGKRTDRQGNKKQKWAPSENLPTMQNRFFGSGATYVNFLGEGIYAHPDGDKFIIVTSWFSDAYEGLAGIELRLNKNFTTFADSKCSAGFSQSCDTALIACYQTAGPFVYSHNIFVKDKDSYKYQVNKGVFPIIKALWQPDKDSKIFKTIENALFMIETQCMIEGPEYYYSKSDNQEPPGFESNFTAYKSRGLMVAIKYNSADKYTNYVIDPDDKIGFFKYFKPQNEKRYPINCRQAYDAMPRALREKAGYYWECEEAFGLYEISSPFTFETQLAAKMSFCVRVGDNTAILFLLAYDIDKWPANGDGDNPTHDTQFPKIYAEEEYSFKSAYIPITFNGNSGAKAEAPFTDFVMMKCLRPLAVKKDKSDRALEKLGKAYFKWGKTTYPGIIVPKSYHNQTGYDLLPEYRFNEKKDESLQIKRGVVRLVRWRTMEWKAPKTNKKGEIQYTRDDEVEYEEYIGAIAQCAVSYTRPLKDSINQYYVGKTVLLCFYQKKGSKDFVVKNLHIPEKMVWQEENTTGTQAAAGTRDYREHLLNIASLGMIDTIIIEKKITKKRKKDEEEAKLFEVLAIPVITSDNQTYLAVTKDCEYWQIAGKVGSGSMQHLVAEFVENKEDE